MYQQLRVNKALTHLINKRLTGLNFKMGDITEHTLFAML